MSADLYQTALDGAIDQLSIDYDRLSLLVQAAHQVWRHHAPYRLGYSDLDHLGDMLYHLTDDALGRCARYDAPGCLSEDEQRARYGMTWAEIDALPLDAIISVEFGSLPEPKLGNLERPDLFTRRNREGN